MSNAERFFGPAVAMLLAVMVTLQVTTAVRECQTFDEHIHLSSGYAYWKEGAFPFNMEHPALVKLLAAAPLLLFNPALPTDSRAWKEYREDDVGIAFLYHNRISAERLLLIGRLPMMLLAAGFGAILAWWTRRRFGAMAGFAAVAFYALDPNIIAHSRYVTTDMPLAIFFFLTCIAAVEYLESGSHWHLLLASLLFGLALITKYSAFVLVPVLAILYGVRWWQRPQEFPLRRLLVASAALFGIGAAVILLVYWPDTLRCLRGGAESFEKWGDQRLAIGRTLAFLGKWLHLPTHTYPFGLQMVADHNRAGHPGYLLGMHSQMGWWYYFPVAFAVKSTVAALLAFLVIGASACWWVPRHKLRSAPLLCYGLTIPPIVFFAGSMTSTINIGMRHILPVYPFLYVLAAVALLAVEWPWSRALLAGLLVLQAVECLAVYPNYLAFFNVVSGGPAAGPRYLMDSNLDWGQDMKKLALWLRAHGTNRVYLSYFGRDPVEHEHLEALNIPSTGDLHGREGVDGFVAASVTYLMGSYVPEQEFAWLRQKTPAARIGYSIYVYDLRKQR